MSYQKNIIILYDLFQSRKVVKTSDIERLLNVCKRTAYRYVNALLRANIPISYDESVKGYRLYKNKLNKTSLNLESNLLILIALKNLSNRVNKYYKQKIDNLTLKLLSNQEYEVEEIISIYDNYIIQDSKTSDISSMISLKMIQSAISFKKKIKISTNNEKNIEEVNLISDPQIIFKNDWEVSEYKITNDNNNKIKDILQVTIE